MKVVVVGGGWAGCAAAISACKQGAQVTLLERTDMILGTGLVGGIMRNNGRLTATEEMMAMGGGDLFEVLETTLRHKNINFPGHEHADLYDVAKTPIAVYNYLLKMNIDVHLKSRINKVYMSDTTITGVEDSNKNSYYGDVFLDTTGTAGPMNNCSKYGNGCAMCILRCPSFGGRVSLAGLAGANEIIGKRSDGSIGAMSGSCKLSKESLSKELQDQLNQNGVAIVPLPKELIENQLGIKACQQYALKEFAENMILLDTGHAKLMTPYCPYEKLHKIPGFETARYEDPYSGSLGNSMRFFAMCHRNNCLKVDHLDNLFCAGEKAGLLVGHTEAIVTGVLAGYNAVRHANQQPLLELPRELAIGEAIAYVNEQMNTEEGSGKKYTFSGSVFFQHMKDKGLYQIDVMKIQKKVDYLNLTNIFSNF